MGGDFSNQANKRSGLALHSLYNGRRTTNSSKYYIFTEICCILYIISVWGIFATLRMLSIIHIYIQQLHSETRRDASTTLLQDMEDDVVHRASTQSQVWCYINEPLEETFQLGISRGARIRQHCSPGHWSGSSDWTEERPERVHCDYKLRSC